MNNGYNARLKAIERHKRYLQDTEDYEYIRSFFAGDTLPNGKISTKVQIEIKHIYCGNTYIIGATDFIKYGKRCSKCCGNYNKSFVNYVKTRFGIDIYNIMDEEKNVIDPKYIPKNSHNAKIWIKCPEKDYHGSYEISCGKLIKSLSVGKFGCLYCAGRKIHPKDSFAQYHIDNTDKNFLEKYWDFDKNIISPWEIAPKTKTKVWIKCQNKEINKLNRLMRKEYHGSYEIQPDNFSQSIKNGNNGCKECSSKIIHPYDSFGYHHFDKVMSWHPDNEISPFRVAKSSRKKYKFICPECRRTYYKQVGNITYRNDDCPVCSASKGERIIKNWLDRMSIKYCYNQQYFKDLLSEKENPLRPDFILPKHKIWIEYDGEFHYKPILGEVELQRQQKYDKRKNKYAKKHGWKLIRIPYWEFDNIENILTKELMLK